MLEPLLLLALVALFGVGYATRSYVGAVVPVAVLALAVILYQQRTPTADEVDVLPAIFVVASGIGVLHYLAGVALGRRSHRGPSDGASAG
jgi:putative effector of murein hydrolase